MNKNIMLPMSVATDMFRLIYRLMDYELDDNTHIIITRLENALNAKVEAMEKRRAYTEYKMASAEALPIIIEGLKEQGYRFDTLDNY